MRSLHTRLQNSWSTIVRYAAVWTLICVALSVGVSLVLLGSRPVLSATEAMLMATAMPVLIGIPFFIYTGLRIHKLRTDNHRLGRVARTDSLTSCLTRGAFTAAVDEWLDAATNKSSGALLMIDADNFKAINDLYGHHAGDEALTIMARSIRSVLRNGDLVGRMGGEEFGVFLPDVTEDEAAATAERIRRSVNLAIFTPEGQRRELSVSIGGAVFCGRTTFSDLFRIADQRLYGAKHAGRNVAAIVQVEDHPVIKLRQSA
jgi:diguanylate cyclase